VLVGCIERYLGDLGLDLPYPAPARSIDRTVAVVGSGPAGLSAAFFLAAAGLKVSLLEKESQAGGLLRYGIPAYRLPRDILDREVDNLITSLGIELQLNRTVAEDDIDQLLRDFDFVFCAPGLGSSIIPAELQSAGPGVEPGLELLKRLNLGQNPAGERFAVVGGGNVAVDVARCLIRCGKEVQIVYRRTFEEMPAYAEEKTQALEEGVVLRERRLIASLEPDESGLRLDLAEAENQAGSIRTGQPAESIGVDRVVLAVGQAAHMAVSQSDRLFLGGDYQTGPATVVEAMASGRRAAEAILATIDPALVSGWPDDQASRLAAEPGQPSLDFEPRRGRLEPEELDVAARRASFEEIRPTPDQSLVLEAASRCLGCGSCNACGLCWFFCPDVAISLEETGQGTLPRLDLEHCKGCGLCAAVCPRGVIQLEEDV
jgi:NADPH-dependent glutamate synthase beta subunit-like oxidoreductase/Pyruvate/2-oxoacid:ferredoxin oxidoreductase delta subunit